MIEESPFIFFISPFADASVKLVWQNCRSIDVSTPTVINICHPVNHAHSFTMYVDLEAIAPISFKIVGMNTYTAFPYGENAVRHLKLDDFSAAKAFIPDHRVDIVAITYKARKQAQQN